MARGGGGRGEDERTHRRRHRLRQGRGGRVAAPVLPRLSASARRPGARALSSPRIRAFSLANSSSVSTPCVLEIGQILELARRGPRRARRQRARAPARRSLLIAGSSWAQRLAWRRLTRLETDVAVPATTAVRAMPRSSPGITSSFRSGRCLSSVKSIHNLVGGNALVVDQHPTVAAHGGGERTRPAVLVDDHGRRAPRLDRV